MFLSDFFMVILISWHVKNIVIIEEFRMYLLSQHNEHRWIP